MIRNVMLAVLAASVFVLSAAAGDECKKPLVRFVSLPMTVTSSGGISVPIKVNDIELPMLVDTGAFYSGLQRAATDDLGLKPKALTRGGMVGFGGKQSNLHVVVHTLAIGGVVLHDRPMFVLPEGWLPEDFDGILGAEIMKYLDVDFDYAGGKINFYSQEHCEGRVVYWTNPAYAAVLPFDIKDNDIKFEATLDGKTVDVILDSGASHTLMSLETAMSLFGFDAAELAEKQGQHAFKTLAFGDIEVRNPAIRLYSDEQSKLVGGSGRPKMVLGQNIMRALHLYIAYKEHRIYMTPAVIK